MANFNFNGKKVYYETHGEGAPIVLLNGIMMSTLSWHNFVKPLSANNTLVLVDFLDQGQSDKCEGETYTNDVQVELVKSLLEHLNYEKAVIAGVSYGGNVALKFATTYPEYVHRLIVFNVAARTGDWLREMGESWTKSMGDPVQFYNTTIPVIYSPEFYNSNPAWVKVRKDFLTTQIFTNKVFLDGITRLTRSADEYDIIEQLGKITAKTLIIGSEIDPITPFSDQRFLHEKIKNSDLILLPGAGHASMYEKPALFVSLLLGFANSELEGLVV